MSASEHVHFIGIGGYGMSAIARVMLDMGYVISGSDVAKKELTDKLQDKGAKVYIGHEEKNVDGADIVVYSTDIPKDNVEMKAAQKCRIPLIHRVGNVGQIDEHEKRHCGFRSARENHHFLHDFSRHGEMSS